MKMLLLILSGAVSGMVYAAYDFPYIIYLSLIPFFYLLYGWCQTASLKKMYLYGFAFFYPYYVAVFHWFTYQYPMEFLGFSKAESLLYIVLAWLGVALLMTILFSFIPVCMGIYIKIWKNPNAATPLFMAFIWCLTEWLNSKTYMAVPWARIAVTQQRSLFSLQTASVLGSFFSSFVIVFFAAYGAYALFSYKTRPVCSVVCMLCASALLCGNTLVGAVMYYGDYDNDLAQSENIATVCALQGNMLSGEKWEEGSSYTALQIYTDLIYEAFDTYRPDIFVLPETAIPVELNYFSSYKETFSTAAKATDSVILAGAFYRDEENHLYNAIYAFTPDGEISQTIYKKRQPVPFGEFLPFRTVLEKIAPILADINAGDDLTAGTSAEVFFTEKGNIGSIICFDSIFELFSAESARDGAQLLAISTNDSWFLDSAAIYEHNGHAILRSIETRRYTVRSANSGMSSVITPRGDIIAKLDPLLSGSIGGDIILRDDLTFFTKHSHLFISICFVGVGVLLSSGVIYGKKQKNTAKTQTKM